METLTRLPAAQSPAVATHQEKWPRLVVAQGHCFGRRAGIMRDHLVWFSIGALTATVATVGAGILLAILATGPRRPGLDYYRKLGRQARGAKQTDGGGPS
jgi:hypothetical protein